MMKKNKLVEMKKISDIEVIDDIFIRVFEENKIDSYRLEIWKKKKIKSICEDLIRIRKNKSVCIEILTSSRYRRITEDEFDVQVMFNRKPVFNLIIQEHSFHIEMLI